MECLENIWAQFGLENDKSDCFQIIYFSFSGSVKVIIGILIVSVFQISLKLKWLIKNLYMNIFGENSAPSWIWGTFESILKPTHFLIKVEIYIHSPSCIILSNLKLNFLQWFDWVKCRGDSVIFCMLHIVKVFLVLTKFS